MKRLLVFGSLAVFGFCFSGLAFAETDTEILLEKIYQAQEDLKETTISWETREIIRSGKRKVKGKIQSVKTKEEVVVGREIALRAWDPDSDKFYTVYLSTPYPTPKPFAFSVLTSGYEVEHVAGRAISKLNFKVWQDGKRLLVLAGKHFWIPPNLEKERSYSKLLVGAKEAIYTPYSEDFYSRYFVKEGVKFLVSEIERAKKDLRERGAMSRALPYKLLADAMPTDYILNLGLNEQMDHEKFARDPRRAADEIAIEYAIELEDAFRWIASSANARGAFQFTNRGRGRRLGTYDTVVNTYEEVELLEDFEDGTQNLQNMIKAAICLLDTELAKFPKEAHELFERDYRVASYYTSAAYNGGWGKANQLYKWVKRNKKKLAADSFNMPLSAVGNRETHTYLQKQAYLWSFIDEAKADIESKNQKER